jgi:hypothetical protein
VSATVATKVGGGDNVTWTGVNTWTSSATFQNADFSIGGSTLVVSAGSVGIGGAPAQKLHVTGGNLQLTGGAPFINLENTDSPAGTAQILNFQGNLILKNGAGLELIQVNRSSHVILDPFDSPGFVGLGTTSPGAQLDVNGAAQFGAAAVKSTITAAGSLLLAAGALIDFGAGSDDDLTAADVTDLTDGGQTTLHSHAAGGLGADSVGGTHIIDSTITAADLAQNSVGTFQIIDSTITNADISASAEIDPAKINGGSFQNEAYTFPGNLTVSGSLIVPGTPNELRGSASNNILRIFGGSGISNASSIYLHGNTASGSPGNVEFRAINTGGGIGDFIFYRSDGGGNDFERMRLTSAGNLSLLGVTTSSGGINLSGGTAGAANAIDFGAGAHDDLTAADVTALTDGGQTALHSHAASLGADSVGGTHIIDSTITAADLAQNSVGTFQIIDSTITNADISASAEIDPAKINGGSFQNEDYTFPGNLGIGGAPSQKLHVTGGNLRVTGAVPIVSLENTDAPAGTAEILNFQRSLIFKNGAGTELFYVRADSHVVVDQTNDPARRLGVGTPAPGAKFHLLSTNDHMILEESDGGANEKKWTIKADGGNLLFGTINDGSSSFPTYLTVARTGDAVDQITVNSGNFGVGTTATSLFQVNGALATAVATLTGAATLGAGHSVVACDASGGAFTVTLPTASGIAGRQYTIKKIDSSANAVTVDANGAETIDGNTTVTLALQWNRVTIVSDGTNWLITAN